VSRSRPSPDQSALFEPAQATVATPPAGARVDPHLPAIRAPHAYLPTNPTDTQQQAAARVEPRSGSQRARILSLFRLGPDAKPRDWTDEELANWTGLPLNSVRPRRLELVEGGWVRDSGRRRPTPTGASATVWEVVP
jgi:hypothetical protein